VMVTVAATGNIRVEHKSKGWLGLPPLPSGANFGTDVAVRVNVVRCDSIMLRCDSD
jgi:hypothetical protein